MTHDDGLRPEVPTATPASASREQIELVVSVMAYPVISTQMGEVVCVAGFRSEQIWTSPWVRLFPFHVRRMPADIRVHKWDIIRLSAAKTSKDGRPESMAPDMDSIEIVGRLNTRRNWEARRALVDSHRGRTMLDLLSDHLERSTSLGVVEPGQILDLEVTARPQSELVEAKRKAQEEVAQGDLFSLEDRQPLEPVPFDFHFIFRCVDESEPRRLKVIDWEINQAFRQYRSRYDRPEERIREHWLNDVCGPKQDPAFFVGNLKRFPEQWLLLGIFWPKRL